MFGVTDLAGIVTVLDAELDTSWLHRRRQLAPRQHRRTVSRRCSCYRRLCRLMRAPTDTQDHPQSV